VASGTVYQSFLNRPPCNSKAKPGRLEGEVIAFAAGFGKIRWRTRIGPTESSPLVADGLVYVGDWRGRVYALDAATGRVRWTYQGKGRIKGGITRSGNRLYVGTYDGYLYALRAKTGKVIWRTKSQDRLGGRGDFYSTPTVAYGRVFIGNADGTVYAFGASTGNLLWAREVGTYVYTAAAVWRRTVFVGTWDGTFIALDARTGEPRWRFSAPSGITGAPTVLAGLVYFSTCGRCGAGGLRRVKIGPRRTFGLNARNGDVIWRFHDGKYSPLVADGYRIYIVGRNKVYALIPQGRWLKLQRAKAVEKCARLKRAKRRARCLSKARRGTTSAKRGPGKAARTSRQRSRQQQSKRPRRASDSKAATQ
jgi:outer membrane protein assembly factor BamB